MNQPFTSNLRIGILGGGQLGRMISQKSLDFGLELHIMDAANSPSSSNTKHFTEGNIRDYDDVVAFGKDLDVLTIEIENVNVPALYELEKQGVKVFPQPKVIELIQDKGLQKQFYERIGVPTAPYLLLESEKELESNQSFLPAMQKLRKGGYDGKGVQKITDSNDFAVAFKEPSVLEQFVDLDKELSVIVARNEKGETKAFPTVEQEFNDEANLVEFLFTPASVNEQIEAEAKEMAMKIITELDMIGLLAVEFFLDKEGKLFVNEIAPRPHNSGHQTIEGNFTSQFEQHLRAISNLPLGDTGIILPAVMINLLGEKGSEGITAYEGMDKILSMRGVYPHLYGKKTCKPFRKMGHVTVISEELSEAQRIAREVKTIFKVFGQ